jgi:hypothetical protein
MIAIEELAEESLEICKELLQAQGRLAPFVVIFTGDGKRELLDIREFMEVEEPWERASKQLARATIVKRLRDTNARGYIMHIEAWTASFPPEAMNCDDLPRPRDVPERREVLFAEYEAVTDTGEVMGGTMGVHFHHDGDDIVFGEEIRQGKAERGTFVNMLSAALNTDA